MVFIENVVKLINLLRLKKKWKLDQSGPSPKKMPIVRKKNFFLEKYPYNLTKVKLLQKK